MPLPRKFENEHLTELIHLLTESHPEWKPALTMEKAEIKKLFANYSNNFYRTGFERMTLLGESTYAEAFKELLHARSSAKEIS